MCGNPLEKEGTIDLAFLGVLYPVVLLEIIPDFCLKRGNQICGFLCERAPVERTELFVRQLYTAEAAVSPTGEDLAK